MTQEPAGYDPAPAAATRSNAPEMSVGDLARALKRTVEDAYGFVRVRGEISQPKRHTSGHVYLRLKDDSAVLEAVCWKGTVARLAVRPEEGMEVVCTGRITTYPGRSQYQLVIETMELAGEGALLKMLEERRRRLAGEGLFAAERKRPLPFLPDVIGVVTSPTGAVIRDILHRLADRFPRHVLLWPVAVQGEGAAAQVARAVDGFNALPPSGQGGRVPRPDLIIVARGGGSLEDLMAFNEEAVVRAVARGTIPLISAVGHETDTTLIDFAADRRAPTPTAAAEMAVPVRLELLAQTGDCGRRLTTCIHRGLEDRRTRVRDLGRGLGDPRALLEGCAQRLDDRAERLGLAIAALVERSGNRVRQLGQALRHPREVIGLARSRLEGSERALITALRSELRIKRSDFQRVAGRLNAGPIAQRSQEGGERLADLGQRLEAGYERRLRDLAERLTRQEQLLASYSYQRTLERGFALVLDDAQHPLTHRADARPGQHVTLRFADGQTGAVIEGAPRNAGPRPAKASPAQESLF
jgi:exodeoxyribonuclease VII large subunit